MFIKMMSQILMDIRAFALFLTLVFTAFTNAFYVMAYESFEVDPNPGMFTGNSFMQAFCYTYLNGLGGFDYEGFDDIPNTQYLWIIWYFEVIFVFIVLLNLLIAIMTSSF